MHTNGEAVPLRPGAVQYIIYQSQGCTGIGGKCLHLLGGIMEFCARENTTLAQIGGQMIVRRLPVSDE